VTSRGRSRALACARRRRVPADERASRRITSSPRTATAGSCRRPCSA